MSRIQNILEKAEREGTVLRTSRLTAPVAAAAAPVSAEPPAPAAVDPPAVLASGPPMTGDIIAPAMTPSPPIATATPPSADGVQSYTVRLNPLLVAGLATKSLAAEQYRTLRTRIAHAEGANALRTVLVTSPQKGEGKSITAANLSLTMAQELQRRVVIVEADLRKPSLQHLFGLPPGAGLAEYLAGAAEMKEVMKFLPDHNLTVIPAGMTPTNPAELLGSTAMRRVLDH